jgi:hypothetical protein
MIDLPVTLLEYFGVARPPDMQGTPLGNIVKEEAFSREAIIFGAHGGHVNVTDGRYVYMRAPDNEENAPLYEYTLMPTHMRNPFSVEELQDLELEDPFSFTKGCKTLKIPAQTWASGHEHGTLLFDLHTDPKQEQPLKNPEIEVRLVELMRKLMLWNDSPPEQFLRLGIEKDKGENP